MWLGVQAILETSALHILDDERSNIPTSKCPLVLRGSQPASIARALVLRHWDSVTRGVDQG